MVRSISSLGLFNTQNVQGIYSSNLKANAPVAKSANVAGLRTTQLNMNEMAGAIQNAQNEEKDNGITFSEVLNLFKSGKFDPRKMGEIIIKSGNNEYRIYVGKDPKYGNQDLIILENRNVEKGKGKISGSGFRAVFTFEDYDKMVKTTQTEKTAA